MQPTLTIITPIINGDNLIDACVRNVIEQDCAVAEHLILDLSTSRIAESPVGKLAQRHQNIIYLSKPDCPLKEGLNHAVGIAKGAMLGFLYNRSFYNPRILKRMVKISEGLKSPTLVVGNCNIVSEDDDIIHINKPQKLNYTNVLASKIYPYHPVSYFYHKSLHEEVGAFNYDDQQLAHLDIFLRIIQATPARYYDEVWGTHISAETLFALAKHIIDQRNYDLFKQRVQQLPFTQKLMVSIKRLKHRPSTRN